jgi:hypothetical protein
LIILLPTEQIFIKPCPVSSTVLSVREATMNETKFLALGCLKSREKQTVSKYAVCYGLDIKCAPRRLGPQCKLCRGGALEK